MVSAKARKVKGLLGQTIQGFSKYPLDSRVVLTGTATKAGLSAAEQPQVWSLAEACSIADPAKRAALLGRGPLHLKKAYQFEADFERITRNTRQWRAAEGTWDGHRVVEEDYVVHPRRIWREHRAERVRDPRFKALLRIWAFDQLPPGLNSPEHRRFIADRETRAVGLLHDLGSRLATDGSILLPTGEDKDEILTQHFELRTLSRDWTTLDRFLERTKADLTLDDRLLAASALVNAVAELHTHGIAHRDLGMRSVWVGSPSKLAISGLMACQIPGEDSLGDWYSTLRGYSGDLPEDGTGDNSGTAKQRDVFTVGSLVRAILGDSTSAAGDSKGGPSRVLADALEAIDACLERATHQKPAARYDNVVAMADDFALALERGGTERADQSILDRAETTDIPYIQYPPHGAALKSTGRINVYVHQGSDEQKLVVKIWLGLRRGANVATDLALAKLTEGVGRLIVSPVEGLPSFIRTGLSPVGPFAVYRHADGVLLDSAQPLNPDNAVEACQGLIRAVDALHAMDFFHGDITPKNILVRPENGRVTLLDAFDLTEIGDARVRTPNYCPDGWERLTEQQIDRYATLKVAAEVIQAANSDRLGDALSALDNELERGSIETFEPAIIALNAAHARLHEPEPHRFLLCSPDFSAQTIQSDDGTYFVRVQRTSRKHLQYSIAGVDREVTFELERGSVARHWLSNVGYGSLMHASMHGIRVKCRLDLAPGEEAGFAELLGFLQQLVAPPVVEEPATADPEETAEPVSRRALDIPRYWRRLIELEEAFQPEVEILRDLGSRGALSAYSYERQGGDFDFDTESAVDVRLRGRKVGEIDLIQTDERTLVIRYNERPLLTGDRVTLVDRRAKASLDRRSKATDKILNGEAALPSLVQFFCPDAEVVATDYDLAVDDSVLDTYGLNPGQKKAFRHILRYGPVGLLQGPPGTGKTLFIAALVHWLVTQAGASKILIASQSHEAVNNAIEKLVDLFKGLKRRPSLLRIGSKGITQKIRPYHTNSSRERYRVRFDNAFKHRVVGLGAAVGLKRDFVEDAIQIDRTLGRHVRRIHNLTAAARNPDQLSPEDKRRYDNALRATTNAFRAAAESLLDQEVDAAGADEVLDEAYDELLDRHSGTSPADVRMVRGLIQLSSEWSAALSTSHRNFEEFLAKTRTIVTATCVGVGQTRVRIDAQAYDWVIVDEAARCTPGELAVPIQVGRRVLLVGDHLQLRPMIERVILDRLAEDMSGMTRTELSKSDFERAYGSSFGKANGQILNEQYRMNRPICDLVSAIFYEPHQVNLFTSEDREEDLAFSAPLAKPLNQAVTWIDTSADRNHVEKQAEWNKHTLWNEAEVGAIIALLGRIASNDALVSALAAGEAETPIGIVCMYSAQKVKIEQAFAQSPWESRFRRLVRVDTVDSYQGKENAIVIVSLVRCNHLQKSGHVSQPNRCNVALSRAKDRLFIVGACRMWAGLRIGHPMRSVLEYIQAHEEGYQVLRTGEL